MRKWFFCAAELMEVAPDAEDLFFEEVAIGGGEGAELAAGRGIEPGGDGGGDGPEDKDGRGDDGGVAAMGEKEQAGDDGGEDGGELEVAIELSFFPAGLGLGGGLPLEEALAGDEAAGEGAADGVDGEQRLVGEEGEVEDGEEERGAEGLDAFKGGNGGELEEGAAEIEGELDDGWQKQQRQRDNRPVEGAAGQEEPAADEEEEGDGLDQRTAEIVEDLPAGDGGDGVGDLAAGLVGHVAGEPLDDLPVAADPAMFAAGVGGVVRGVVVDDFDVGDEAGAGVGAFDEVVREEGVARESAVEDLVEDRDLVDAFAGEDALAEEVLVDVGDGARVDIEAGLAGVEGGEARARGGGDADTDAGLQDAVAEGDDAELRIDDGLVERVGHGADHAGGGAAGELRVGVEGDDEADGVEDFGGAALSGEAVVVAEDELVEVEELAALALPAHPRALAGVEGAVAMEEEKGTAALAGVLAVEVVGEGEGEGDEGVAVFGLGARPASRADR